MTMERRIICGKVYLRKKCARCKCLIWAKPEAKYPRCTSCDPPPPSAARLSAGRGMLPTTSDERYNGGGAG